MDEQRAEFEAWADDYGLRAETNYSKHTEFDCFAAWKAATQRQQERIAKLEHDLRFVERWANHHGAKPHTTAEEALSVIQHYPPITRITRGYADGVVPDTFDPYSRIAELEAQVQALTTALFECREAFPIPEPGSLLEPAWMGAMTDPEDVPPYVKAQVQALSLDADRYQFAAAYNDEGRLNFKSIYDAWDGDGSFTDQIDAAIAAGKGT